MLEASPNVRTPRYTGELARGLLERARRSIGSERRLLGIAGPPGAGKSTFAAWLVRELQPAAAFVPMDGFHLANRELARLGLTAVKGSPPSFDAAGFANALQRLATRRETVYLPAFAHGGISEAIAGSIPIETDISLAVVEGNYLLLDQESWRAARALLDDAWYLDLPAEICRDRLIRRHIATGRDPTEARAWVESNDLPNVHTVERSRARADLVIDAALLH